MTFLYHCLVNVKLQINCYPLDAQLICVKLRFRPRKTFVGIITAHLETINLNAFCKGVCNSVKTLTDFTISIKWNGVSLDIKRLVGKHRRLFQRCLGMMYWYEEIPIKRMKSHNARRFFLKKVLGRLYLSSVLRHILLNIRRGLSGFSSNLS